MQRVPHHCLSTGKLPDTDDMEGELVSFSVSCSGIGDDNPPIVNETTELSVRLYRLQPYTAYTCCAVAHTTVGVSGASCTTQTTLEDGKYTSCTATLSAWTLTFIIKLLGIMLIAKAND